MNLSGTSHALLGLLSIRPWTTYELAQQAQRSLHYFFPRAERNLYAEAKRLAEAGLAEAEVTYTGRRSSTTYSITPAGRAALRSWLREDPEPPVLEMDALLRVFFADAGRRDDLLATLEAAGAQAARTVQDLAAMEQQRLAGTSPFPERTAMGVLAMRLVVDLHRVVDEWAGWAAGQVATWEHADGRDWSGAMDVVAEIAALAGAAGIDTAEDGGTDDG